MEFVGKDDLVKRVQQSLKLDKIDGVDGPVTWKAIVAALAKEATPIIQEDSPIASDSLSPKALKLILDYEVGGGEGYYNKYLRHPDWPGASSGVTIGVGYDLGHNTLEEFTRDWNGKISSLDFDRLAKTLGKKGKNAENIISPLKDISISWEAGLAVFKSQTLPRFIKLTKETFPQSEDLHPDAFGALLSLVFNRGDSLEGPRRTEMAKIKELVPKKDYKGIAAQLRSMKRLWTGQGVDGLLARREDEAALVASCS